MKLALPQVIDQITAWIAECDLDDLADLVGEVFGGECTCEIVDGDFEFTFIPNENYCGAFDEEKK
jgi:hypothetical protein